MRVTLKALITLLSLIGTFLTGIPSAQAVVMTR